MMPAVGDHELFRRLKADSSTRDIPVVFLAAKADIADEKRWLEMGAVDCTTKPITPPIALARVKTHLALEASADLLRDTAGFLGQAVARRPRELQAIQDVTILSMSEEIALSHQEKWDGAGYPEGLKGEAIPVSARLMALADVYDALISRRVYKEGMPHERAVGIIRDGAGTHFGPDIVDAFPAIQDEFRDIARRHADADTDLAEQNSYSEAAGFGAPKS